MTDPEMAHFYRGFAKMRQLTQKDGFSPTPPTTADGDDDQADDSQDDDTGDR